MNAAITGAWSKQRTRISLNGTPPTGSAAAAAAQSRAECKQEGLENTPGEVAPSDKKDKSMKRKARSSREQVSKRGKMKSLPADDKYAAPPTRLRDIGGMAAAIEKALELVAMPLCHPEIYLHTGVTPPRGVLFHGPPGCGLSLIHISEPTRPY